MVKNVQRPKLLVRNLPISWRVKEKNIILMCVLCIKPDEKVGNDLKAHTYYTWVGSETTGYQLKLGCLNQILRTIKIHHPKTDNDPTDNDDSCVELMAYFQLR